MLDDFTQFWRFFLAKRNLFFKCISIFDEFQIRDDKTNISKCLFQKWQRKKATSSSKILKSTNLCWKKSMALPGSLQKSWDETNDMCMIANIRRFQNRFVPSFIFFQTLQKTDFVNHTDFGTFFHQKSILLQNENVQTWNFNCDSQWLLWS